MVVGSNGAESRELEPYQVARVTGNYPAILNSNHTLTRDINMDLDNSQTTNGEVYHDDNETRATMQITTPAGMEHSYLEDMEEYQFPPRVRERMTDEQWRHLEDEARREVLEEWNDQLTTEDEGLNEQGDNDYDDSYNQLEEAEHNEATIHNPEESERLMSLEESHGDYVPDEVLITVDETPNTGEHQVVPRRMWQGERSTSAQMITMGRRSDSTETVLLQPISPNTHYEEDVSETLAGRIDESTEYETRDVQDMSSETYEATALEAYERQLGTVYGADQLARHTPAQTKKVDPVSLTKMIVAGLDDRLRESLRPIEIQCGELIQGLGMIGKDVIQLTTDIKLQKIKTDAMMNSLTPQGQGNKKQNSEKTSKKLFQPKLWQTPGVVTGKAATADPPNTSSVNHKEAHPAREDGNKENQESNNETATKLESQNGKLRSLLVKATSLGKSRKTKIAQLQSQVANSTTWAQNKEKDTDGTGEAPRRTVLPPSSSTLPNINAQVGPQPDKKVVGSETIRKSNRLKKGKVTRTKGLILTDKSAPDSYYNALSVNGEGMETATATPPGQEGL